MFNRINEIVETIIFVIMCFFLIGPNFITLGTSSFIYLFIFEIQNKIYVRACVRAYVRARVFFLAAKKKTKRIEFILHFE